jgi:uncharacterized membrane protein YbhN (UPF0104 family)
LRRSRIETIIRILAISVRLLVTVALLWILVTRVDLGWAVEIIGHASVPLVGAMLGAVLLANLLVAFRWHLILAAETKSPGLLFVENRVRRCLL